MATDADFALYVVDQFEKDLGVTSKKMFGEYGLFSGGKIFGLICDDRLFIKPTEAGRAYIGDVVEGEPYPGAKPSLLIGDRMEDGPWLSELARITVAALPAPKPKKPRKKK
jgi:TfoX/Sxy family transcriptional regulator of competence genes